MTAKSPYPAAIETGRRFVNTWECDENAHMNVQFYTAHFEDAEPHFWLAAGLAPNRAAPRATSRIQRFHRELHAGDSCVVFSALAAGADGEAVVCHFMESAPGRLSATCVSGLGASFEEMRAAAPKAPVIEIPEEARPRSMTAAHRASGTSAETLAAGFVPTYRGLVLPRDCHVTGEMTAQLHVARFSDAASHFWHHLGFDKAWRDALGVGTVAVEMRLTIFETLRAGDPIVLLSGLTAYARKTITFQHRIFNARDDRVAAVSEVTALAMDLTTRRAIEWPEDRMRALETMLCAVPGA